MDKDFLDKIVKTQDKIADDIVVIKIIQAKHDENLKEHMRRTNALEKSNELTNMQLEPIKTHVRHIEGALKVMGALATLVGIVAGLTKIFNFL